MISPLHKNQNVRFRQKLISIEQYFAHYPGVPQTIKIRGDEEAEILKVGAGFADLRQEVQHRIFRHTRHPADANVGRTCPANNTPPVFKDIARQLAVADRQKSKLSELQGYAEILALRFRVRRPGS